jgi:hypothetical protein
MPGGMMALADNLDDQYKPKELLKHRAVWCPVVVWSMFNDGKREYNTSWNGSVGK